MKRIMLLFFLLALVIPLTSFAQDTVTIEWWTFAGNEQPEPATRSLIEKFEAEHPNIKVNVTILPESAYNERMTTTLGAGEGAPDVAWFWDNNWLPQALDLGPYLEADSDLSPEDFFEGFWVSRAMLGDTVIGLPIGVGANFVMYNKDVFDEAGVDYPTADWTPDDFIEIAQALTDPDIKRWGGDRPRGPFRALWRNMGAIRPYSDDSTTVDGYLNSPEAVTAYTWLWDLVDSGATPTPADIEILGTEGTGPVDLFIAGRIAMATLNNGHMLTTLEEGVNFGVVPEPHVPGNERWTHAWSLTASIWEGTEHPDEAYEFLSYLGGPEGQRHMMLEGNQFPSIPEVLAEYEDADEDYAQAFFSLLGYRHNQEWDGSHPCWRAAVIRAQQDAWDLIMLSAIGRDEIQATLDGLVPDAQIALDECVGRLGA